VAENNKIRQLKEKAENDIFIVISEAKTKLTKAIKRREIEVKL